MLKLMKKDLSLNFTNKSIFLIYPMCIIFIAFFTEIDSNAIFRIFIFSMTYFLATTPFNYELNGKTHYLIQSLPIKKSEIVISRYLSIITSFIIGFIFSVVCLWLIGLLGLIDFSGFSLSIIKTTLPTIILSLSIIMPLLFKLPPKIASIANMFIIILIININIGGSDFYMNIIKSALFPIISIVIYFISMIISLWIYENRDFL